MNMRVTAAQSICRAIVSGFTHADNLAGHRVHYERCRQDAMAAALRGYMAGKALRDCCGDD